MGCRGKTTISTLTGILIIFAILYLIFHGYGGDSAGSNPSQSANGLVTPEQTRRQHAAEDARRAAAKKDAEIQAEKPGVYEDHLKRAEARQDKATKVLFYCVNPKAQYGQFSSYDGGKSAGALLFDECPHEFASYIEACVAAGNKQDGCLASALAGAQIALRNFNK